MKLENEIVKKPAIINGSILILFSRISYLKYLYNIF